jgi:hypothetical protein
MDMAVDNFIVFLTIFKPQWQTQLGLQTNLSHVKKTLRKEVCETKALHKAMVGSFQ